MNVAETHPPLALIVRRGHMDDVGRLLAELWRYATLRNATGVLLIPEELLEQPAS